ncbi:WBM0748 family T4SS-associated protein [Wolbachia endosymbiont of Oedothorax gibbosus]|uniref:WBM0748 family T4SS-associated protein n=1 Tax=Wolbachia endosymbiont of Oedothorax gibbosus TaxID=931100 RepID=UPI0020259AED|nr:hypothetical protein [Wolbachia endosymbiont of Oedothorax gibbosus]
MSLKNKISELIEQQFSIKYHDNYLAYTIHKWAANEISSSIAFCIMGYGNCKIKYQDIAKSFGITTKEIDQGNIASIESKIKSEAEKTGSKFSKLISKFDESLKEQSEMSVIQILSSSAEEMLKSFFGKCNSTAEKEDSSKHESSATEGSNPAALPKESPKPPFHLQNSPEKIVLTFYPSKKTPSQQEENYFRYEITSHEEPTTEDPKTIVDLHLLP